jgi:hypothetical protein
MAPALSVISWPGLLGFSDEASESSDKFISPMGLDSLSADPQFLGAGGLPKDILKEHSESNSIVVDSNILIKDNSLRVTLGTNSKHTLRLT